MIAEPVTAHATLRSVSFDPAVYGKVLAGGDDTLVQRDLSLGQSPPPWEAVTDFHIGSIGVVSVFEGQRCAADTTGVIACSPTYDAPWQALSGVGHVPVLLIESVPYDNMQPVEPGGYVYGGDGCVQAIGGGYKLTDYPCQPLASSPFRATVEDATGRYMVGDNGAMVHLPLGLGGSNWSTLDSGTTHSLRTIAIIDKSYWAAGDEGTIVASHDGTTWSPAASPTKETLRAAAACPPPYPSKDTYRVIVGDHGTILMAVNDGSFEMIPSGTSASLLAITCEDKRNFVAVGEGGTILRIEARPRKSGP